MTAMLSQPPPADDADLADYLIEFLVDNGLTLVDAQAEVAGFAPSTLRPSANYAWATTLAMREANQYRRRFRRLRHLTLATPMLFLLAAAWYVAAPLIPDLPWLLGNYTIGALLLATRVAVWRHQ
jgi:hypothetical protein